MVTAVLKPSLAPSMKASYTFIFLRMPAAKNIIIMVKSSEFAPTVEYSETLSCGKFIKKANTPPIRAVTTAMVESITLSKRFIRCFIQVIISPARVDIYVAIRMGRNTSEGFMAPICARYTITLMGTSVRPVVFSTKNIKDVMV